MGFINKITKMFHNDNSAEDVVAAEDAVAVEDIVLASSSHVVEDEMYMDEDEKYLITFQINDAFKEAKSHSDADMLSTYAPDAEYGTEGDLPCVAILMDDEVYCAVEEFKEEGTFDGAIEVTPLSGQFYFKAKMEYYGDIMYFYGMDRCDGEWENNGLCLVYPKAYLGTDNETKLMRVLDEAAESYSEQKS